MIVKTVPTWILATNCWVVADGEGGSAFVVDAAPEPEPIVEYLDSLGLTLTDILLTHGHVDHTGGAAELAKRTGATVHGHPADDYLTLDPEAQFRSILGTQLPGSYGVPEELQPLEDGQILELHGAKVEARHTPGHTPGSTCFYIEADQILFSGDHLFAGSIGRTDFPKGSHSDLMDSMANKVLTLEDSVGVLPGHGPVTTIGAERRGNPFL